MKKVAFLFVMSFITITVHAQFKYTGKQLIFGNISAYKGCSTNWDGWAHAWVAGSKALTFDMSPADPRIGSNTGSVVFYGLESTGFNDIHVKNVFQNSDLSAKTNISSLRNATPTLLKLRPVKYQWNNHLEYLKASPRSTGITNASEFGFIAQEVERVIPDIVIIDEEGNRLINYSAIIPILTASIQELNNRIVTLEKELEALKAK